MKAKKPNPEAQLLGRLGGKARARVLTSARRSEIARTAVAARIRKYGQERKKQKGGKTR